MKATFNSTINDRENFMQGNKNGGAHATQNQPRMDQNNVSLANWAQAAGQNVNKSAIVQNQKDSKGPGFNLPDKLLKMREKVKRDRSANVLQKAEENRDNSLYGRRKATVELDQETQRLRESYSKHRNPSSRSFGGGRGMLQKQNFKEDPFDKDEEENRRPFQRGRGSTSFDRNLAGPNRQSDKENAHGQPHQELQMQNQKEAAQTGGVNHYKRTQQKSHQTLATYQQKYARLEQNFQKFTNNIQRSNQSEQIIENLKQKTGLKIMTQIAKKTGVQDLRAAFKMWRLNSGMLYKQKENEEKMLILGKYCQKFHQKSLNYVKIQYYQKWKQRTFQGGEPGASGRDRTLSCLSEIVTSSQDFNRCVENDFFLSKILNQKLSSIMSTIVSSDLFFYSNDDEDANPEAFLKAYHDDSGEQINFSMHQVMSLSLLGKMLKEERGRQGEYDEEESGVTVRVYEKISSDAHYNKDVDMPINQERIIEMNNQEPNSFNRVRGLTMVLINFNKPKIGILRLFFNAGAINNMAHTPPRQLTALQTTSINQIANIVPLFLQRILDVRSQINSLALSNMDQSQQIRDLENFNAINQSLKDFQVKTQEDEIILSSLQNLVQFTRLEVESFLKNYFDLENVVLKQIIKRDRSESNPAKANKQLIEIDKNNKDLVRIQDHHQEDKETIEDFLDFKKEYYVHQISVCPKNQRRVDNGLGTFQNLNDFSNYTFILHITNYYKNEQGQNNLSHNLSALNNASTSANSVTLPMFSQRVKSERQYLNEELKHKLGYYFRHLAPVLQQARQVAGDLMPRVARLKQLAKDGQTKYEIQQFLQKYVTEQALLEELDQEAFYSKLTNCVFLALQQIGLFNRDNDTSSEEINLENNIEPNYFSLINKHIFHRNSGVMVYNARKQFQFQGFLSDFQIQLFNSIIIQQFTNNLESAGRAGVQNFEVFQNDDVDQQFKEIGVSQDILPFDLQVQQNQGKTTIILPVISKTQAHTLALLVFDIKESKMPLTAEAADELSNFLSSFIERRQAYQNLQEQHDKLLEKLHGEKMTRDCREVLDELLVLPFMRKQSLKALGEGIDQLCDRLVLNSGDNLDEFGQEISQIAFISPKMFIDDIRLLQSYNYKKDQEGGENIGYPDQMMLQSFNQRQQIVYEDDLLDKVVILYPLISSVGSNDYIQMNHKSMKNQFVEQSQQQTTALMLRFVIDRDNHIQQKLKNIHMQLINRIQPTIIALLQGKQILMRPSLGLAKLSKVIDKYRYAQYRELIYFIRDLKAKNVFNFSRSRLYELISKSRKFMQIYNQRGLNEQAEQSQFFDQNQKLLEKNRIISDMIRQSIFVLNQQALKFKRMQFKKFVVGTRRPLYSNMPKKKKKALCTLFNYYQRVNLRELFTRYAINTKMYRSLRHPRTKYIGSVNCIFRNFRVISERLAFLKLKKNLNIRLRQSMNSYHESDKDLFIQLNQILLSSHTQQGGLEGGFMYGISEIFQYLKNLELQDHYYKDYGNVANDSFVGHIDEAILTMKSSVYTSHGGLQGNTMASSQSPKIRIFISKLSDHLSDTNQNLQRAQALRFSYDSNLALSQQDQLLNQINAVNVDNEFNPNHSMAEHNEFENNLSHPFGKFLINLKRDLIHQMLTKSNGIIFNFQNIQQSLSDVFLSQQSHHKDQNIGNRYAIVRRSKSALIIPLFDISLQEIVGSFELYRYHQQAFTEEIETRFDFFSKRLADYCLLYGQLKAQSHQISQLKVQIHKSIKPVRSLSQLLKDVYVNAPGNHFFGACHVLPIIILNQVVKRLVSLESEQATQSRLSQSNTFINGLPQDLQNMDVQSNYQEQQVFEQKLAFFYNFKDNLIYNFEYEGTFIDELMANGCILEMCQKGSMRPDEAAHEVLGPSDGRDTARGLDEVSNSQTTYRSNQFGGLMDSRRSTHRRIENPAEQVKSVTNQLFKHIVYYPIFDVDDEQRIVAIMEVAYKKRDKNLSTQIMNEDVQHYLDQFRSHLGQFKVRMSTFSRNIQNLFLKRYQKQTQAMFHRWKQAILLTQYREQFQVNQYQNLQNQEMCYSEYMTNLQDAKAQLKTANEEKDRLQQQVSQFMIEKKAKLKFLATSLASAQNLFKKTQTHKLKQAFLKWQYNVSIRKIAETAFNRVLEINHRHSRARFKTAVYLLKTILEEYSIQGAFNSILQAAHMTRVGGNMRRDRCDEQLKSRSRSRSQNKQYAHGGADTSFVLHNITSILSPQNLKKIERQNLYQQHINSFYTPIGGGGEKAQDINSSAITNQKNLFQTQNLTKDGSTLPLIQLKPDQIIKQAKTGGHATHRESADEAQANIRSQGLNWCKPGSSMPASRYSMNKTNATQSHLLSQTRSSNNQRNPYSDLNVSQIEYTQHKRDYSPIITTSKYDLRKIYDPYNKSGGYVQRNQGSKSPINISQSNLNISKDSRFMRNSNLYQNQEAQSSSVMHKKSRSVEHNCSRSVKQVGSRKHSNNAVTATKAQLQKQLHMKQKQLDFMKRQLADEQKASIRHKSKSKPQMRHSIHSQKSIGSKGSFELEPMDSNISTYGIFSKKANIARVLAPKQQRKSQSRNRSKSRTSLQFRKKASAQNQVNHHHQDSQYSAIQSDEPANIETIKYNNPSQPTQDSLTRTPLHLINKPCGSTISSKDGGHVDALGQFGQLNQNQMPIPEKYAQVNGRDVSPPVRLERPDKRQTSLSQQSQQILPESMSKEKEMRQRATRNVITALHQRYEDLQQQDY